MIQLTQETESLARRIVDVRHVSVDMVVWETLAAAARADELVDLPRVRDASPKAIAHRHAAFTQLSESIAALPLLDGRPVQEIVDDITAPGG